MFFIAILALSAFAIASSAAFFSVFGLANTFAGIFWSVVVMGGALQTGKLVAASYLYRYWTQTSLLLKIYLISGIIILMIITSTGIFGFLSSGYQQDILPLQQLASQLSLFEEEKQRALERKKQIDAILASGPTITTLQKGENIDTNAIRALRETRRSRESLLAQYKDEQKQLTQRIVELDKEIVTLKQKQIEKEAHVGPIIYIAKTFQMSTDDATKYLILLIIFAFDPMAVSLTLALNIALEQRKKETKVNVEKQEEITLSEKTSTQTNETPQLIDPKIDEAIEKKWSSLTTTEKSDPTIKETKPEIIDESFEMEKRTTKELEPLDFEFSPKPEQNEKQETNEQPALQKNSAQDRSRLLSTLNIEKNDLQTILEYYRELKHKTNLSGEERNLLITIETFLKKKGLHIYVSDYL